MTIHIFYFSFTLKCELKIIFPKPKLLNGGTVLPRGIFQICRNSGCEDDKKKKTKNTDMKIGGEVTQH